MKSLGQLEIWEKVLAGLVIVGVAGGIPFIFAFYVEVSSMMKLYQHDKNHNDMTRKELVSTLKQLNIIMNTISTNIALHGQRITAVERDVEELRSE